MMSHLVHITFTSAGLFSFTSTTTTTSR